MFDLVTLQDPSHVGFDAMIDSIMRTAEQHLQRLDGRRARDLPGLRAGGRHAVRRQRRVFRRHGEPRGRFCTDLLVRAGATVMFSEIPRSATAWSSSPPCGQCRCGESDDRRDGWYDSYLEARRRRPQRQYDAGQQEGRSVEYRREGDGLDHQVRQCADFGRVRPGEKARDKGLIYAATPASDFICGTLQLAAGMNLHVFTTGRGTPYGLARCR